MEKELKQVEVKDKYSALVEESKVKYKDVFTIKVARDTAQTDFAIGILRKPTRIDMKPIMSMLSTDPLGALEVLMQRCWLGGDAEILTDDDLFLGACSSLQSLIEMRYSEIKKN